MTFDHPCCVCGVEGSFGYGVFLLEGQRGTWYCREHRPVPLEEASIVSEPEDRGVLPSDDGKGPRITVTEVARSLQLELPQREAWSVGAEVRDIYERRYGKLPPKDLREKTNDGGTHCFALYPEYMREQIAKIIKRHKADQERQGDLF